MSSISVAGDTSGSVTLQAPAVAGSTVLTLPAVSGTVITNTAGVVTQAMLSTNVAGNGPAFSAYQSVAQTLSSGTATKIQFQTEEYDTANCFDNVTNYRFTPNVAGYYLFAASLQINASNTSIIVQLMKNNALNKSLQYTHGASIGGTSGSASIYCNGTTDYIEVYGTIGVGQTINPNGYTWFQGILVRAA